MTDTLARWFDTPAVAAAIGDRDGRVMEHRVTPLSTRTWLRHVGTSPAAVEMVQRYADATIARGDLAAHATAAMTDDTETGWVELYMACQLWGVGTTGRVHWTSRTLADSATPDAFASLARAVQDGEYWRAAGRWAVGWNASFTTKFAYAVSLALDPDRPKALVHDDRVARQLESIDWSPPETGPARFKRQRLYAGYCESLHEHAGRLGCRPDTLEWVLFAPPQ